MILQLKLNWHRNRVGYIMSFSLCANKAKHFLGIICLACWTEEIIISFLYFLSQFEMMLSNFISGPLIIHSKLILFFLLGDCRRTKCVSGVWIHSMWRQNLPAFPENAFCAGQPWICLEPPMKGSLSLAFPKEPVLKLVDSLYFVFVWLCSLTEEAFT